jgi:hypothetical protein
LVSRVRHWYDSAFQKIAAVGNLAHRLSRAGYPGSTLTTVRNYQILQLHYHQVERKIDSIVNEMEDSSITLLIDMLVVITKNKRPGTPKLLCKKFTKNSIDSNRLNWQHFGLCFLRGYASC